MTQVNVRTPGPAARLAAIAGGLSVIAVVGAVMIHQNRKIDSEEAMKITPVVERTASPEPSPMSDQESLRRYLSGDVTIGINGTLPGFSLAEDPEDPSGFDIALVKWLQKKYGFRPNYVKLLPAEREGALGGKVKIVLANLSWTADREKNIDFAGPYFVDQSGVRCSTAKSACDGPIPQRKICVTTGTRMAESLPGAAQEKSIVDCMRRFYDPDDQTIGAVATDLAILQAYGNSIGSSVASAKWATDESHPISEEKYGIGLPNNRPDLCRALNADLDQFLSDRKDGWDKAFSDNLPGLDTWGRNPQKTDPSWCEEGVVAS